MEQETFKTAEELEQDFLNYLNSLDKKENPELLKKIYYLGKIDFYDLYGYTQECLYLNKKNIEKLIYKKNTEPLIYDFFNELEKILKDLANKTGDKEKYNNREYKLIDTSVSIWESMISFFNEFKKENEKNKIYLIKEYKDQRQIKYQTQIKYLKDKYKF